jgi:glycosyltransferase involved in cell wall biosynthesis
VPAKDPLSFAASYGQGQGPATGSAVRPRIGFGCFWEVQPERTWSGSAWNLREGLRKVTDTVDVGIQFPALTRKLLRGAGARYHNGRLTTSWCHSRLTAAYIDNALRRGIREQSAERGIDAIVLVDQLVAKVPGDFYIYADCSLDSLIGGAETPKKQAELMNISLGTIERRRRKQMKMYERAAGVITMSHWFARSLVEQSGISPDRVHVAHPGFSAGRTAGESRPLSDRQRPRRKMLFIGRQNAPYDFYRKGGDLVVEALALLRREYDPELTLTLVGMDKWPQPGPIPEGVTMLGVLPPDQVSRLYDDHDIFVMPSRQESFGIVFTEALSRGLPCVGRNAYAMPEMVTPGVSGALIDHDDTHELARAIVGVLENDEIYRQCQTRAAEIAAYFSWERTARDVVDIIARQR